MASSIFPIALLLVAVAGSILTSTAVYAQNDGMVAKTSKGTLDVRLEQIWDPSADRKATFKVSFLNPGTNAIHQHQDYDFKILKDDTEVFSAAKQTGQAVIHNAEGTITVPYTFPENGDYTIQIVLAGTGIAPTIPTDEEATFPIKVTPEFPMGALGAVAALMATTIVLARYRKLF
jgi:hypothetical protein